MTENMIGDSRPVVSSSSLTSTFVLSAFAILLTGLVGSGMTYFFGMMNFEFQQRSEALEKQQQARQATAKLVIQLASRRLYYTQVMLLRIESETPSDVAAVYPRYERSVEDWNLCLAANQRLLRFHFKPDPKSGDAQGVAGLFDALHSQFRKVSRELSKVRKDFERTGKRQDLSSARIELESVANTVNLLCDHLAAHYDGSWFMVREEQFLNPQIPSGVVR